MAKSEQKGPKLEPHQIILRPLISEKGTRESSENNAYAFEVNLHASKPQIKAAVEQLFDVKVVDVRTMTRVGKVRRFRGRLGKLSQWKKAVVRLHAENRLELF